MEEEAQYARAKWAEKLGVSVSGYYAWLQDRERRQRRQQALEDVVVRLFGEGEGTYGVDRICGILRREGTPASYKVIQRVMSQKGLKSCHRVRRQRSLTDSRKARGDEYKNLTKDLEINTPFQVLSSDISYIRTGEGFDYLCQIRDVCVMSIEIPVKNHQEFPGFIKDLPGKNHGFVVAVCRISACVIR